MSQETSEWLNRNVLVGVTDKRGTAWHYRKSDQGAEPNHYPGFIPPQDVKRRLFDWLPESVPLLAGIPVERPSGQYPTVMVEGKLYEVRVLDNRQAIVPSDRIDAHAAKFNSLDVFGVFKGSYTAHPYYEWLVNNVENLLDDDLGITAAGLLRRRGVAWVEISLPENRQVEGVEYRPNLLGVTSLDGSFQTTYKKTVQETVCDNTMSVALSENGLTIKIRHSPHSKLALLEAREALQLIHEVADEFESQVKELCATKVSSQDWMRFLTIYLPGSPKTANSQSAMTQLQAARDSLGDMWTDDPRVTPWKGTAFGVLQAVNTWETHERYLKPVADAMPRVERNMLQVIKGKVDQQDNQVLKMLSEAIV